MSFEEENGVYSLPDEILLEIFQYFAEEHLCRVSQVCKLFYRIANDKLLWKSLYRQVYEYDQPLFKIGGSLDLKKFEFVSESKYENPWRESFMQLYEGVHVRPGFKGVTFEGRNLQYFDEIIDALEYVENNRRWNFCFKNLIFLHAGTYTLDYLYDDDDDFANINIESNIALIGAASGKCVAKSVIIKSNKNIMYLKENLEHVYVGYLTLELTFRDSSNKAYCLAIYGSPTIDHCIIKSSNYFASVYVSGYRANPVIMNCDISNSRFVGLHVTNFAIGVYKENVISRNTFAGIFITNFGSGYFDNNEVYDNEKGFVITSNTEHLIILKNKIFNKKNQDYTQSIGVSFRDHSCGKLKNNDICDHSNCGVEITGGSNPVIRKNTIKGNKIGVLVSNESSGLLEQNYIFNSATDNVKITSNSNPTLIQNYIL